MSIETDADWTGLRAVAAVVREILDHLTPRVRPGTTTAELDRAAATISTARGARSAPAIVYGFPGHVLISVNDEVVHGIPGARVLRPGDVVKLDVTIEKDGYIADAAHTVIVPPAAPTALRLRDCAEAACDAALALVRPGVPVNAIGRAIEQEVQRRGFTVIRGLTGHGVGRTIHEPPAVPNYFDPRQRDVLTEGLVLTGRAAA